MNESQVNEWKKQDYQNQDEAGSGNVGKCVEVSQLPSEELQKSPDSLSLLESGENTNEIQPSNSTNVYSKKECHQQGGRWDDDLDRCFLRPLRPPEELQE